MTISHILFLIMATSGLATLALLWYFEESETVQRRRLYHRTREAMKEDKRRLRGISY